MAGINDLTARAFTVNTARHEQNVMAYIRMMENNKAVGPDSVHVEMLKSNAGKCTKLLTELWFSVGRTTVVPQEWLKGITVPLFKFNGKKSDPAIYRPLTILFHVRKLTEKAVVLEFDIQVATDQAQFGFLVGMEVIQVALSVLAVLKTT